MATRQQLQQLARLRLREAEILFEAGCYDGSAYLCGFTRHEFDDLKLLAGMDQAFTANPALLANWSVASKWKPERRYESEGNYNKQKALEILDAVRSKPDGVLQCISFNWQRRFEMWSRRLRAGLASSVWPCCITWTWTHWNLIVSAPWSDEESVAATIRMIADELHINLDGKSKHAISRITVLKADDPFVQDMVHLYPVSGSGAAVAHSLLGVSPRAEALSSILNRCRWQPETVE